MLGRLTGQLVGLLAVRGSCSDVLFRFVVFALIMFVRRFEMMMLSGRMMRSCREMRFSGGM